MTVSDRSGGPAFKEDAELAVTFGRDLESPAAYPYSVGWTLHCNLFGGEVKVGPRRIWIKSNFSTLVGCPAEEQREDDWLVDFFEADPYWSARGGVLILTAPLGTMTLRPGKPPRESP